MVSYKYPISLHIRAMACKDGFSEGLGLSPQQKAWTFTVHYWTELRDNMKLGGEMINVQQKVPDASICQAFWLHTFAHLNLDPEHTHDEK